MLDESFRVGIGCFELRERKKGKNANDEDQPKEEVSLCREEGTEAGCRESSNHVLGARDSVSLHGRRDSGEVANDGVGAAVFAH
jgi:hypothetical protein